MSTHLRLLTFVKPYKKAVFFGCLVVLLAGAFGMIMPKLLQWSIDTGLKPPTFVESGARLESNINENQTVVSLSDPSKLTLDRPIQIEREKMRVDSISGNSVT